MKGSATPRLVLCHVAMLGPSATGVAVAEAVVAETVLSPGCISTGVEVA